MLTAFLSITITTIVIFFFNFISSVKKNRKSDISIRTM
jgi:hypothetical protein